jgi:hypothetical protein
MKIQTTSYLALENGLPQSGQHILAHQVDDRLVVYQAYNKAIADFALENQYLGGSHFSYSRMSWIKPNFLWMMYRCGWASKENQERVLALWIKKADFEAILAQAVFSAFKEDKYKDVEDWKTELNAKEVRLQWDPDHDPYGRKLTRRAIQLGLKGNALEIFGKGGIQLVEDITEFVLEQGKNAAADRIKDLLVPLECAYKPIDKTLYSKIGIEE